MAPKTEVSLGTVVTERLLEVADYQRPYAWEVKQLQDLWEDIDLMGSGRHFAGTLVLKEVGAPAQAASDGESVTRYEVVDGQQRLTTCLLLLDRVRRHLEVLGAQGVEEAGQTAQRLASKFGVLHVDKVRTARLQLAPDLAAFWLDCILGDEPIADTTLVSGERRLADARRFFDERVASLVSGLEPEAAADRLMRLQLRVANGLRFLVYEVETDAEVGVIFETLNERGRPLTELEKVKNYLLYLARQLPDARSEDLAKFINKQWGDIFQRFSRLQPVFEERLLRAHWLATFDPDARRWQRTQSVKARFPRSRYVPGSARLAEQVEDAPTEDAWDALHDEVKEYVRTLAACATFLAEMYDPEAEYLDFESSSARVHRATAALRRSPVVAIYQPLIFAFRLRHPTDGDGYAALIELCEKYSARVFAICQRRSNAGEPYLSRIAFDLFEGADVQESMDKIGSLLWQYAPDEAVEQNLTGVIDWYVRQALRYFLYEYERSFAKSDADVRPWSDFNETGARKTIEHILPQNPEESSRWCKDFTEAQRATLCHTLGNLVLTYNNSVYSRKDYAAKRGAPGQINPACYYSPDALRSEGAIAHTFDVWTPQEITERQALIAHWAMGRWAVARPSTVAADEAMQEVAEEVEIEMSDEAELTWPQPPQATE